MRKIIRYNERHSEIELLIGGIAKREIRDQGLSRCRDRLID
jgi:hypothetical protein